MEKNLNIYSRSIQGVAAAHISVLYIKVLRVKYFLKIYHQNTVNRKVMVLSNNSRGYFSIFQKPGVNIGIFVT